MPVKPSSPTHGFSVIRKVFARLPPYQRDWSGVCGPYIRGRRAVDVESLVAEALILTISEWNAALPEQRNNGKLVYLEPSSLERRADTREDAVRHGVWLELLSRLEARLSPEQVPYLDAFLAGDKPQDVVRRSGISARAASARSELELASIRSTSKTGSITLSTCSMLHVVVVKRQLAPCEPVDESAFGVGNTGRCDHRQNGALELRGERVNGQAEESQRRLYRRPAACLMPPRRQFAAGLSAWSMTMHSTGPFLASSFNPNCS
jgi:hypothetical protein